MDDAAPAVVAAELQANGPVRIAPGAGGGRGEVPGADERDRSGGAESSTAMRATWNSAPSIGRGRLLVERGPDARADRRRACARVSPRPPTPARARAPSGERAGIRSTVQSSPAASRRPPRSSSCQRVMISTMRPRGLRRVERSARYQSHTWSRCSALSASAKLLMGSSMIDEVGAPPGDRAAHAGGVVFPARAGAPVAGGAVGGGEGIAERVGVLDHEGAGTPAEMGGEVGGVAGGDDGRARVAGEPPRREQH